ncbi:MAG: hypothetical protein IJ012_02155 [Clostridia bacterium]|nr:hypothetical protein [Clostridia bacterium]
MSQESFIQSQIENQKKIIAIRKARLEKGEKRITALAVFILILNVICLLSIPFVQTSGGETMSMQEAFAYEWEQISNVKLAYFLNWVSVAVLLVLFFVTLKKRSVPGAWVGPQLFGGMLNFVALILMLLMHATAEIEVTRGTGMCYVLWFIPFLAGCIYAIFTFTAGWMNRKIVTALEQNIAKLEQNITK